MHSSLFLKTCLLHCGIEDKMNTNERLGKMALAITQLAYVVNKLVLNEGGLTNLVPIPPCKTMTTTKRNKTSYVLSKRDCHEGVQIRRGSRHLIVKKTKEEQDPQHNKALKKLEGKTVDLELTKPTNIDDIEMNKLCCNNNDFQFMNNKKASCALNKSECYKEIQKEKDTVPLFTKEISEDQTQQQSKALKSVEDEALDTELIKTIPVNNIENNKLHQENLYAYCDQVQTIHIDDIELNNLHLQASSSCCELNGFYFIEDEITNFSYDCRYHTNSEQRTEGQLQTQKEFRHEELQEGPLLRKHLKLLHSYGISTTFNLDDSKKHESNAELRTILFKEGGIDAIIDSPQSKAKEEKHNCIIALAKPIEPIELADFCLKTKEDHFQIGLNNNMEAWQDYEAPKEELPAAHKQNSSIQRNMPATKQVEYQSSGQPSLRTMERPTWCTYERGNPRVVIFGHGILSQDLELARSGLTEPTRAAPRSRVRQLFDSG